MSESFDLRAETRFKNNVLYNLIFPRFMGVRQAAEAVGVPYQYLLELLTLKRSPNRFKDKNRDIVRSGSAVKIAEYFGLPFEEVFPETLYALSLPAVAVRVFSSPELVSLSEASRVCDALPSPEDTAVRDACRKEIIRAVYRVPVADGDPKTQRQKKQRNVDIIRMRFGFDGYDPMTLDEIGERFAMSKENVRRIEAHILRQLRGLGFRDFLSSLRAVVSDLSRKQIAIHSPQKHLTDV